MEKKSGYNIEYENEIFTHKVSPEKTLWWIKFIFDKYENRKLTVLDLGASNAMFYKLYGEHIKTYHAFDVNYKAVEGGKYYLKCHCNGRWKIGVCDLSDYRVFYKKYKEVLLKKYDIVVFSRVFHHLYRLRQFKKWNNGKYDERDILLSSMAKAKKWYAFSTTYSHMIKYDLHESFLKNGFDLVFEDNKACSVLYPNNSWHCIYKKWKSR